MRGFRIGGFTPFTLSDYPGRIAAIVFTQGCNLACPFCHNKSLIPSTPRPGKGDDEGRDTKEVLSFLQSRKGRLQAVVVSGGEPTLQPGLCDFLSELRRWGFALKLDTNGTNPDVIQDVLHRGLVDFVAMDLKAPWDKYRELAGKAVDVSRIKRSMEIILASGVECLFRTTFVPHLLTEDDMASIRSYIPAGTDHVRQKFVPQRETDRIPA